MHFFCAMLRIYFVICYTIQCNVKQLQQYLQTYKLFDCPWMRHLIHYLIWIKFLKNKNTFLSFLSQVWLIHWLRSISEARTGKICTLKSKCRDVNSNAPPPLHLGSGLVKKRTRRGRHYQKLGTAPTKPGDRKYEGLKVNHCPIFEATKFASSRLLFRVK